jgi:glyoxylase-like metal-dependent hydrolase (beta-lactamase superfamily II)
MSGAPVSAVQVTGLMQHSAWADGTLPQVEMVRSDLWSIPVPMAGNPLRYVSVYAFAGDRSVTLIDAGWSTDDAWQALNDGLAVFGASVADVEGCLVTHAHFDHIGLAGRICDASGGWMGLHPADCEAITRPEFRDPTESRAADRRWRHQLGAPPADVELFSERDPRSTFPLPDRLIEDADELIVQGRRLHAVHTPGHTRGHLCFVEPTLGLLFSGDHLLPRISPNIAADRSPEVDALGDYLNSLDRVAALDVDEVLPAHEWRYRGHSERVRELKALHARRLAELLSVVGDNPGITPWDMAGWLTWSRPWESYGGSMRRSAVSETMAHVVHLVRRGLLERVGDGPVWRYRRSSV